MGYELRATDIAYLRRLPEAVHDAQMYGLGVVAQAIVVALLSGGHVLLEGNPGLGKTSLVKAVARALGLGSEAVGRIQFTPDLMPADITGTLMPAEDGSGRLEFKPGPIFRQLLIADEINRATPKTQAAMLEAMGEFQVTSLGQTYPLRRWEQVGEPEPALTPFMVMATQNPIDQEGTYDLPEAQSDRFMMKIRMAMPRSDVLGGIVRKALAPPARPTATQTDVFGTAHREALWRLHSASRAVLSLELPTSVEMHIVNIVQASNGNWGEVQGLSSRRLDELKAFVGERVLYPLGPRAAVALAQGALGWSAVVLTSPEEAEAAAAGASQGLAAVLRPVLRHRLKVSHDDLSFDRRTPEDEAAALDAFLMGLALRAAPDTGDRNGGRGYHDRWAAWAAVDAAAL